MESNSKKPAKSAKSTMSILELLSDGAITHILSSLPVKSILRFRRVCKSWRSLISSPHFVKFHLNRVVNDVALIRNRVFLNTIPYRSIDCDRVDDSLDSHDDFLSPVLEPHSRVLGSCNGLLCVECHVAGGGGDGDKIVVFNPTVRTFVELPKPSLGKALYNRYGFGYDSVKDDYKLLRVLFNRPYADGHHEPVLAEIFSFRNGSWKIIDHDIVLPSFKAIYCPGVFFKGALHWLVEGAAATNCLGIVAFNLRTERFDPVRLFFLGPRPDAEMSIAAGDYELVVMQGCISVACYFRQHGLETGLEVWAMKEHDDGDGGVAGWESWTKTCTVSDDENADSNMLRVRCATKNGGVVFEVDVVDLVIFDPRQRTFRRIGLEIGEWFQSAPYFETLVSPRIGSASM